LITAARASSAVSAGWFVRWYFRSPLARCSATSQASSPGKCWARAATGPSATRTRSAANSALSGPLVPFRHEMVRNAAGRLSISSAAATLAAEGTGCLRGRPVGLRAG